jgi:hypothetical protein
MSWQGKPAMIVSGDNFRASTSFLPNSLTSRKTGAVGMLRDFMADSKTETLHTSGSQ